MSRQRVGHLVLLVCMALSSCASEASSDGPPGDGSDSDTSAAHGADASAPGQAHGSDAPAGGSGSSGTGTSTGRPPVTASGRDAQADAPNGSTNTRLDAGTPTTRDGGAPASATSDAAAPASGDLWRPKAGTRWQWDLSGDVTKLDLAVDAYDIDGFGTEAGTVSQLHAMGKKAICYLSVGTLEPDRPDAKDFPKEVQGKFWAEWNETYIDIRSEAVRAVMKKRLDMCKTKGFDAIEPDNMDMFEGGMSGTGFPLTEADGVDYAKWLATEAHARNMSIGQKNASSITSAIEPIYDFAITEDCFNDGWCDDVKSYADDDKAVFQCEYTDTKVDFSAACTSASKNKFSAILKKRDLDAWIQFCP